MTSRRLRVASWVPPSGRASFNPESRPQLEELRSGEWVTEAGLLEAAPVTGPPASPLIRS